MKFYVRFVWYLWTDYKIYNYALKKGKNVCSRVFHGKFLPQLTALTVKKFMITR